MQFPVRKWQYGLRVMGLTLGLLISCSGLPALGQEQQAPQGHYEAWLYGVPQGVAIFDQGLVSNRDCVLQLLRADGSVCRTLATRLAGPSESTPLVWACLDGSCVGSDFSVCHSADNPLARLVLFCDDSTEYELLGPQQLLDPSSAGLSMQLGPALLTDASFHLIPTLYSGTVAPQPLCTVTVDASARDGEATVLRRAASAINQSAACAASGVSAGLDPSNSGALPSLRLEAANLVGTQLVPSLQVAPGDGVGRCFSLTGIGLPELNQTLKLAIHWTTASGGAAGGEVKVVEHSPLGTCAVTVPTVAGQSAASVASTVHAAFHEPGISAADGCAASQNPRDVGLDGSRITTVLPSTLEVCVNDSGIGFSMAPAGLEGVPPVADCQDLVVECTAEGQAQVTLDASGSSDPDGAAGASLTFEWYQDYDAAGGGIFLGFGEMLDYSFPLGLHDITVVVTDETGLQDMANCTAHVVDTEPPVLIDAFLTPTTLYPPNHEMIDVQGSVNAYDVCSSAIVKLVSITSNEPDDAPGTADGATSFDVQDAAPETADFNFSLRAERDRDGVGRTYRVSYEIRDEVYNTTSWTSDVVVPVDLGGVVEPITISVSKIRPIGAPVSTVLDWTDVENGTEYDVIRGDLQSVVQAPNYTYFGSVQCLVVGTPERHAEDSAGVAAGETAFYLVDSIDGQDHSGVSTETAAVPRAFAACPGGAPPGPIPDPERNSSVPTSWGWQTSVSEAQIESHLAQYVERLVDIDRLGPDEYQIVQVRNAGDPYAWPAFWWKDQDEAGVTDKLQTVNGRILDLEPFVAAGQTRFAVSIIPNEGKRAKAWGWNYDLTPQQVLAEINMFNMRLIDLEVYEKGGQTYYAYVSISNTGVDQVISVPYFNISFQGLENELTELGGRLIDLEVLPDGNLAAIVVQNNGTYWSWGVGLTAEQVGSIVGGKALRLVDLERYQAGGQWLYAFVSIDNVNTDEGRRLRPILDGLFDDPVFGGPVKRGLLVKEANGPVIAELGAGLRFQPASTLKLLPYLYAIQEVDRGNATLDSTVSWLGDPLNVNAACLTSGVAGSATFRDALPTMMWYSHNRTLEAFFDLYPPYDPSPSVDTLTKRAQNEWGMADTEMYFGCPGNTPDWLSNRSTLFDIARLYEGVESLAFFNNSISRHIFWLYMINHTQGICPSYYPGCPGNFYSSPYIGGGPGVFTVNFLTSIVQAEGGPGFPWAAFLNEILLRQKGGGATVRDFPVDGHWDGYQSHSVHVTLPFKDGGGDIVPRNFIVAWFVNGWDASCGDGSQSDACKNAITVENNEWNALYPELLRIPIRMAIATW